MTVSKPTAGKGWRVERMGLDESFSDERGTRDLGVIVGIIVCQKLCLIDTQRFACWLSEVA